MLPRKFRSNCPFLWSRNFVAGLRLAALTTVLVLAPCFLVEVFAAGQDGLSIPARNDTEEGPDDLAYLEDVLRDIYSGSYRDGADDLEDYLIDFPSSIRALKGLAEVQERQGRLDEALVTVERWLKRAPEDAGAHRRCASIHEAQGRLDEAKARLREARRLAPRALATAADLSEFLFRWGRRREARDLARESLATAEPLEKLEGDEKCGLARLYRILGDPDRAARAAVYADLDFNGRKGSRYRSERYEALLILGDLYRRARLGYGSGDQGSGNRALSAFRDALKVNRSLTEAMVGIAYTRYYAFKFGDARSQLSRALAVNPACGDARALEAHILTLSRSYDRARKVIDEGLERTPRHKGLLAQRAALFFLEDARAAFDEIVEDLLTLDPHYGELYYRLGELLIFHYRFDDAEWCAGKCLETDPEFYEGYILRARALANLGREDEALECLEESLRLDPFHYPWRRNMLRVLAELDTYVEDESDLFKVRLEVNEAPILRRYLLEWGRESMEHLGRRYGYTANGPILMEMFPHNEDFAVRTVGFTGLGALGACFGKVVTLLSPKAGGYRGRFRWATTLHHELAHVFTLQMSKHRIPRWFTEGISVFEEEERYPRWRRNLEFELFNAWHNRALFKLKNFDAGFMGPRVLFAYYQAGLVVRFIEETQGLEAVRNMVIGYGSGLNDEALVRKVLGLEPDAFDKAFRDWVWERRLADVKCEPFVSPDRKEEILFALEEDPKNPDRLLDAAWACFRNGKSIDALFYLNRLPPERSEDGRAFLLQAEMAWQEGKKELARTRYLKAMEMGVEDLFAWRNLGLLAREDGDLEGAEECLTKARDCFPDFIDPGSPRRLLLELYRTEGRADDAAVEMEALLNLGGVDLAMTLELGRHYTLRGEASRAAEFFRDAVRIDPFRRDVHLFLARALRDVEAYGEALNELDVALEITPDLEPKQDSPLAMGTPVRDENRSRADIHATRASILWALGRKDDAREALDKALALVPRHEEARALQRSWDG